MDLMFNYGKMAVKDLNGDTKINKEDRVGVLNWGFVGLGEALLTGCDAEIIKKDAGGRALLLLLHGSSSRLSIQRCSISSSMTT